MTYIACQKRYETMRYDRCGKSGILLPKVSLGLWHNFGDVNDDQNMRRMCFTAFDLGITHFDLADNYGPPPGAAEENFGRILREDMRAYRDEMVISTKAGYTMWEGPYGDFGSRKHLMAGIDQSLKRLGLEYVDIFYHHRMDKNTPLEETMLALSDIVRSGKALYVGLSNYTAEALKQAARILDALNCPFLLTQNRYSMLDRTIEQTGVTAALKELGKGMVAFSPLAQGLLTDRYLHGVPTDSRMGKDGRYLKQTALTPLMLKKIAALNDLALSRGEKLAQMALAWCLNEETVTGVIIGASRPEQILENCGVISSAPFTKEELSRIEEIVHWEEK